MMCLSHRSCCMHIMRAFGDGFLLPGFRHQGSPVALSQVSEITVNRNLSSTRIFQASGESENTHEFEFDERI